MPNNEEVTVEISPEGEVKVSVKGVAGKSCTDLTRKLEAALGETTEDVKTREYHQVATQKVVARSVR